MTACDELYNSAEVAHDTRWDLRFPSWMETKNYLRQVVDHVSRIVATHLTERELYFIQLVTAHTDMHVEALIYTRQTLGYEPPSVSVDPTTTETNDPIKQSDANIPGGIFNMGATPTSAFIFDNEKWVHPIEVAPFSISTTATSNGEFLQFVEDGGYHDARLWSKEGWEWRIHESAIAPVYWGKRTKAGWCIRTFTDWRPLEIRLPIIHVNWHEANAYCKWAGRRLPSEVEWEIAASGGLNGTQKFKFPWGDSIATPSRANLDARHGGVIDVSALPGSDSPFGCRQMIGNVWEWISDPFTPYPGFLADPYKEYSEPWFHTHKVLRGGAWTTRSRLIRNTWRNFYLPNRRDVLSGFRSCALSTK